jgi:alpha-tubulin suppressor-like RCC1 family protein
MTMAGRLLPSKRIAWGSLPLAAVVGCFDSVGPSGPPVWASVEAGAAVTCGVSTDGRGYCWGEQWALGRGGSREAGRTSPQELPGNREWAALDAGLEIVCGLTRGGETYCWGPAGNRAALDTVATHLPGDPGFASITVGHTHACGLTPDGVGYCWGDDFRHQTGGGPSAPLESPRRSATLVAGNLRFLALRAGPESTCGLVPNGDLYCWGGGSVSGEASVPRLVQQGFEFTGLDYGGTNGSRGQVCAMTGAGIVYCFAYEPAQLLPQPTPNAVALPGGEPARRVAVGDSHACGLDVSGAVSCWGSNTYGQLGDGTTSDHPTATSIPQLAGISWLTAGGVHSCAVSQNGVAYCWGANHRGQLGNGWLSDRELIPQRVVAPRP